MCGRYVATADKSVLSQEYAAAPVGNRTLEPDYNVAPSKSVYSVVERGGERQLRVVTWGLIPSWAKDPKIGNRLVNARLETASEKPSFRAAWAKRRAVLPADGYYEWYIPESQADEKKPKKQPFYIRPRDEAEMSMAGLYEIWRDPSISDEDDPGAFRWTCTILTTSATDKLGRIHDRMPLLVDAGNLDQWLDPAQSEPAVNMLTPASPDLLEAYPVSTQVNRVSNNDSGLIKPLPADEVLT